MIHDVKTIKDVCHCDATDEVKTQHIKENLYEKVNPVRMSDFFKMIGDETRLKILLILTENVVCVNGIASILDMTKSAISHQLRMLKQARLVKATRAGRHIYYSLDDDHVVHIVKQAIEHLNHG